MSIMNAILEFSDNLRRLTPYVPLTEIRLSGDMYKKLFNEIRTPDYKHLNPPHVITINVGWGTLKVFGDYLNREPK